MITDTEEQRGGRPEGTTQTSGSGARTYNEGRLRVKDTRSGIFPAQQAVLVTGLPVMFLEAVELS